MDGRRLGMWPSIRAADSYSRYQQLSVSSSYHCPPVCLVNIVPECRGTTGDLRMQWSLRLSNEHYTLAVAPLRIKTMSSPATQATRRRRSGDLRVRSGCWVCRERRVKCPEQRPICSHCQRLGLKCRYETRLSWQRPLIYGARPKKQPSHSPYSSSSIEEWMFLNTTWRDFEEISALATGLWVNSCPASPSSSKPTGNLHPVHLSSASSLFIPRTLSPLVLSETDSRLWDYFNIFIAPRCVLEDGINPYRQIILRLAASSPGGPVYQSILAVSGHQMRVLGHSRPPKSIWAYRDRALESLRSTISEYSTAKAPDSSRIVMMAQQILASTLMMCFFEILHDCSRSWQVHATFARSFLVSDMSNQLRDGGFSSSLYAFATTYLIYHDALAFTAGTDSVATSEVSNQLFRLTDGYGDSIFMTLTGCPKRLISLLSQITNLAAAAGATVESPRSSTPPVESLTSGRKEERDLIERELHRMRHSSVGDWTALMIPSNGTQESLWIAEVKRLTALMYFYARIDGCNPSHPHMVRLTRQILDIIPKISLRTNTILWPLFTVATLGIRSESDSDRRLVLEKLQLLQQTRQLGNVRKARRIIEDVWKARDLETSNAEQGWLILEGRYDTISLA